MNNFYQLPLNQQEEYLLQLAYKSINSWGLQGKLSLIKHRENAVYALITDKGERYALRIHRANYHSNESLESELIWIDALAEFGIGVPYALPTVSGENFALISIDEVPEPRQVDLLAWIDGEQIGSIEDGLGDDADAIRNIYLTMGRVAARVHNHSSSWTLPQNFKRHAWDVEGLLGDQPFWGQFWQFESLTDEQLALVNKAREMLKQDLNEFGKFTEDYGMIHADFVPENFLVDNGKVQIIDFDDAGFGWYLFEIATALYFIQPDKNYEIAKQSLIEGYREHRPLSDEKLARLPALIAARSLTYLGWMHQRPESEVTVELAPMLVELCCKSINNYLSTK